MALLLMELNARSIENACEPRHSGNQCIHGYLQFQLSAFKTKKVNLESRYIIELAPYRSFFNGGIYVICLIKFLSCSQEY